MLLPPEAFRYVPALVDQMIEPEKSFLRRSHEPLSEFDRVAREKSRLTVPPRLCDCVIVVPAR